MLPQYKPCQTLKEQFIFTIATDENGVPRKAISFPDRCKPCKGFDACASLVEYGYSVDKLSEVIKSIK